MNLFSQDCVFGSGMIPRIARDVGTPFYAYDEKTVLNNCDALKAMPNAFGLNVRYAMKANSNLSVLRLIANRGLDIDASSLGEVLRAKAAGVIGPQIMLTSQEVISPLILSDLLKAGVGYNVCSMRQFNMVAHQAKELGIPLSVRVHPGIGSGETITRDTGGKYSCFGVQREDLPELRGRAIANGLVFDKVHYHIGSGGDPKVWAEAISLMLPVVEEFFPEATVMSCGGGLRVGRMPGEESADLREMGAAASAAFSDFHNRTRRKLGMEIEPGTSVVANAGYLVTSVVDTKVNHESRLTFAICDGGMECNTRPLLYGSRHPFYVVDREGKLLSSEFEDLSEFPEVVVAGICCESGDSQSLDESGHIVPRRMALPQVGEFVVVGGCGAYCSTMSPANYNAHTQIPEVLVRSDGSYEIVRQRQVPEQIWQNEVLLPDLQ